jgi:hypothetical protein
VTPLNEIKNITTQIASVTFPSLSLRIHAERRSPVVMERAACPKVTAMFAQLNAFALKGFYEIRFIHHREA